MIEAWGIEPSNYLSTGPEAADFDPISKARVECLLAEPAARIDANCATLATTGP
ncbi:hypothetical protein [Streptomyces sp. NPDC056661]|uniref:hypothetical protein n=1 Tax=Streptomyces sp. NPDC056661 TaxID=3345898 RepID=UPI0036B5A6B6